MSRSAPKMWLLVLIALTLPPTLPRADAQEDTSAVPAASQEKATPSKDEPIVIELAQGIDLLKNQITQQQELLKNAQTEREQQLIRNHIRLLQKERRSLEGLLNKLVGPNIDVLEAAREQQAEHRSERHEKTLEKDERLPKP